MQLRSVERGSLGSHHLNLMRGLAALMVLFGHAVGLFLFAPTEYEASFVGKCVYYATAYGHESVMVFFVLSGFLVGSSVIRAIEHNLWSWKAYSINRLSRLLIVLIPALVIGLALDSLGIRIFGELGIYGGGPTYHGMIPGPVSDVATLRTFWGNLFFLQRIRVWTLGSNGPLWSLAYEFWYYTLFPVFWLAFRGRKSPLIRIVLLVIGGLCLVFVGKHVAVRFAIWLMGVGIAFLPEVRIVGSVFFRICAISVLVAVTVVTHFSKVHASILGDVLVGLAFSLILWSTLNLPNKGFGSANQLLSKGLSNASYTIYLFHLPILVFLQATFVGRAGLWPADGRHVAYLSMIVTLTLMICFGMWWVFESRTEVLRKWLGIKFRISNQP